jgi:hypothetical protein
MKRSVLVEGYDIPLGRVLAGAQRHDSPLLAPTLDLHDDLGPLPEDITVHLDAGYDSGLDPRHLANRGLSGEIARKGEKFRQAGGGHQGFGELFEPAASGHGSCSTGVSNRITKRRV